ncbi:MAG: sulfite oxidase-like oxidoreductase [Ignavibacteriae bacterium]|nr:sulfite oxidase-like oxidoreductase [Ignavibacteria bacterium]MBI3363902.1 sulfite oxidase-like oxidoreductase [Ignavibacteriota bacterium]
MTLLDKKRFVPGINSFGKEKTPPGQVATVKFPVLTYGATPEIDTKDWSFKVWGEVEEEKQWTWDDFMKLPQTTIRADFHCVTHWSRFDDYWTGVLFKDLVKFIRIKPTAKFVMQHAYGGYTTNNAIDVMLNEDVILVHTFNGAPLPRAHGGPMRVFTPRRYAWKGAKWVNGLEFMTKDRAGFWEMNGYDTPADPWKEERYG